MTKNEKISQAIIKTKERRKGMTCRVFGVKVIDSKLSREKRKHIESLYIEANWLRNAVVSSDDVFTFDRSVKEVSVKTGESYEMRSFDVLSAQMKQDIVDSVKSETKTLATVKSNGGHAGKLKEKSCCNSIPLRQYNQTYRIDFNDSTITIQGLRSPIKVRGLSQIPKEAELANAKLVRKPSGLYFHITTYCIKECKEDNNTSIGIDFGIKSNLTLTTGEEINVSVPETGAVKRCSLAVNKGYIKNGKYKGMNHRKRVHKLQIAYEKQTRKKKDIVNKTLSKLLENSFIGIQNELIAGWHSGIFGKQVHNSAMGLIKARLKNIQKVFVVPSSFPSTQICPTCKRCTPHPLNTRHYECAYCGYYHPSRDIKSAEMILKEALRISTNSES